MSNCCDSDACVTVAQRGEGCPISRTNGVPVELQTVKALLTETALRRLRPGSYRLCPDPGCSVVYFGDSGDTFVTTDVRVPVWQKEPAGERMVCYCFGENEADIRAEIAHDGRSAAAERVTAHIKAGRCACEIRNPRGACCLGDVAAAVKRVAAGMKSGLGGQGASNV
jgi:hypothetical protein